MMQNKFEQNLPVVPKVDMQQLSWKSLMVGGQNDLLEVFFSWSCYWGLGLHRLGPYSLQWVHHQQNADKKRKKRMKDQLLVYIDRTV